MDDKVRIKVSGVPDADVENQKKFLEILKVADPALYSIKLAMLEAKLKPDIVFNIIRGIGNVNIGTGFGQVVINIHGGFVQRIVTEERKLFAIIETDA